MFPFPIAVAEFLGARGQDRRPTLIIVAHPSGSREDLQGAERGREKAQGGRRRNQGVGGTPHIGRDFLEERTGATHYNPLKGGGQAMSDALAAYIPLKVHRGAAP